MEIFTFSFFFYDVLSQLYLISLPRKSNKYRDRLFYFYFSIIFFGGGGVGGKCRGTHLKRTLGAKQNKKGKEKLPQKKNIGHLEK